MARNPFQVGEFAARLPARRNPVHKGAQVRLGIPHELSRLIARKNTNLSGLGASYGPMMKGNEIQTFLGKLFENNRAEEKTHGDVPGVYPAKPKWRPTPICIWGPHGLGKTTSVEAFCDANNWQFKYVAPAQFEEMGDFHGLPYKDGKITKYQPPYWVPTEEGPGIILFDDVNRADERILRGLMQLFQNYELFSWRLPAGWQIVCTANPEGGVYQVTDMDFAMKTRMLHVTMKDDLETWVAWASGPGKIDPRAIELMEGAGVGIDGEMTTYRSLTALFRQMAYVGTTLADWQADTGTTSSPRLNGFIERLCRSAISGTATDAILRWIRQQEETITWARLVQMTDLDAALVRLRKAIRGASGEVEQEKVSRFQNDLFTYAEQPNFVLTPQLENLIHLYLMDDGIRQDLIDMLYNRVIGSPLQPTFQWSFALLRSHIPYDVARAIPNGPGRAAQIVAAVRAWKRPLPGEAQSNPRRRIGSSRTSSRHSRKYVLANPRRR